MIIQRVISLLDEKSLKMVDLCRYLGINTSTMTNWKKRGTDPPAKYIFPICEFLNVDCEFLLTGKEKHANSISMKNSLTSGDKEWLSLIHRLPEKKQIEFKSKIEGYLECYEESVAADETLKKTGTTNLAK